MKVLLTGAFGHLGVYCLQELLRQGYQVRCFDRQSRWTEKQAQPFDGRVERIWSDVRDPHSVNAAVQGQEAIIHLAAILPPDSDEHPDLAREVNVDGTRNVIEAAQAQPCPPRLLLASSFDLFGHTQDLPPPRRVGDPVSATDCYTGQKLAWEEMVKSSGLEWLILRFSDIPHIALRRPHPIMFKIPLSQRIEVIHPDDAALAITNALKCPEAWRQVLLVGGGARCQLFYRDYLGQLLTAMGVGPLPEDAFAQTTYCTDWLDTVESQRLLQYQRHTFDDIVDQVGQKLRFGRYLVPFVRPLVRRSILKLSPYRPRKDE